MASGNEDIEGAHAIMGDLLRQIEEQAYFEYQ
jgi:hypothetical protein